MEKIPCGKIYIRSQTCFWKPSQTSHLVFVRNTADNAFAITLTQQQTSNNTKTRTTTPHHTTTHTNTHKHMALAHQKSFPTSVVFFTIHDNGDGRPRKVRITQSQHREAMTRRTAHTRRRIESLSTLIKTNATTTNKPAEQQTVLVTRGLIRHTQTNALHDANISPNTFWNSGQFTTFCTVRAD